MAAVTTVPVRGRHPRHETLELGPERELWVHAETWPELVAQVGRAVGEQLLRGGPAVPSGPRREIEVAAADRSTLLTRWLHELLYHAEAEWWIPVEFADVRATEREISAQVRGVRLAPSQLKAAAQEAVRVREVPDGFEAKIVLTT